MSPAESPHPVLGFELGAAVERLRQLGIPHEVVVTRPPKVRGEASEGLRVVGVRAVGDRLQIVAAREVFDRPQGS